MKRSLSSAVSCLALVLATGAAALQPASAAEAVLFTGKMLSEGSVKAGAWGNGAAEPDLEQQLDNERSLKVTTRDFYQGLRLDFDTAQDVAPVLAEPNAYLSMQVKQTPNGTPGAGRLRVLMVGDKQTLEIYSKDAVPADQADWVTVSLPVSAPAGHPAGAPLLIRRFIITSSDAATFHIGRILLVNDDTSISARLETDELIGLQVDKPVTLSAEASGGLTPLKLSWDFDPSDGIQEEKTGTRIENYTFRKPGRYTITLTAAPADDSKKEPAVETIEVEVAP